MEDNLDYSMFRIITDKIQEHLRHKLDFVKVGKYYIIKINNHIISNSKDMVEYIGLMDDTGLDYNEILSSLHRKVYLCANTMTTAEKLSLLYMAELKKVLPKYKISYEPSSHYIRIATDDFTEVLKTGLLSMYVERIGLTSLDYGFVTGGNRTDIIYLDIKLPPNY